MLKSLLPHEVKVKFTNVNITLRSNLTTNTAKNLPKSLFFYRLLGFNQSHSGPLNDLPEGSIQKTPGSYESEKPNIITGIDKIHLKCDCLFGSIVKGIRETILYSFALDKRPGDEVFKELRIKL